MKPSGVKKSLEINSILEKNETDALVTWGRRHLIHYREYVPTILKEGKGAILYDTVGRKYLDFMSGASSILIYSPLVSDRKPFPNLPAENVPPV